MTDAPTPTARELSADEIAWSALSGGVPPSSRPSLVALLERAHFTEGHPEDVRDGLERLKVEVDRARLDATDRDADALAVEINLEHEAAIGAVRAGVDHARRAGELLIEAKANLQHGDWLAWLTAECPTISERTAQGYMRIAGRWPELEAAAKAQRVADLPVRDALKLLSEPGPKHAYATGCFEWFTPRDYAEAARDVLGGIDLDPASSAEANAVIKARQYFTADDDGLAQPWRGRLWLNPPYAQPLVTHFCEKLAGHVSAGDVTAAIVLVNNCTETVFFATLADVASALCFPQGRVPFWRPDRDSGAPLQGQVLIFLGPEPDRFCQRFAGFGAVAQIWRAEAAR